jgi:hypothetical protein
VQLFSIPGEEDLVVGVLVRQVVGVAADGERAVEKSVLLLGRGQAIEHKRLEIATEQGAAARFDPLGVVLGDRFLM